jgi:hypothetical protein
MSISTQNNHKHDNAQVNAPKSTIKNAGSLKEKNPHLLRSGQAAVEKTVPEVEATTKNSLKSSLSANNFDTKDNIRTGEKSSKQKVSDKDEIKLPSTSKQQGKQNTFSSSNLNNISKDKTSKASFAPVSAVRSLNSPIHQKPHSIPNKISSEMSPSYPIPLHTPPPPAMSIGNHSKRNDPVCLASNKCNHKEIELKDNHEGEPLFCHNNENISLNDPKMSCQVGMLSTKAVDGYEQNSAQCNCKEDMCKGLGQCCSPANLNDLQSIDIRPPDIAPLPIIFDIKKANCDKVENSKDTIPSEHVDVEQQEKTNNCFIPVMSDSCEITSKNEGSRSALSCNYIKEVPNLATTDSTSPILSKLDHDMISVTKINENKTGVSTTPHNAVILEKVVSE